MATTKPRITVTITERQHELLKAISEASGSSMSSFITDLLESAEPVLERMAQTMLKLRQLNEQRKASIASALDDAQTTLEPILDAVLGQFDLFAGNLENAVGGAVEAGRDGGTAARAASTALAEVPRPVITGDRPPSPMVPTSGGKPSKTKAPRRSPRFTHEV